MKKIKLRVDFLGFWITPNVKSLYILQVGAKEGSLVRSLFSCFRNDNEICIDLCFFHIYRKIGDV